MTVETKGYSLAQILLHWAIAFLVLNQLIFGESMVAVIEAVEEGKVASPDDQRLASLHYWFGVAILALVAARIFLRLTRGAPAPLGASPATIKLARVTHLAFYVLLVAVPITGLLGYYFGDPWGELHELAKPVFIILIALHVLATFYHQIVLKDGTLGRMTSPGS